MRYFTESLTVTGTKSKFMVISEILSKLATLDAGEFKYSIFMTSLLQDAAKDSGNCIINRLFYLHIYVNLEKIEVNVQGHSLSKVKYRK